MSFVASWRTALRVARREARRHKGRSALVIAMIAAPVLFLAFAAVSYDMFTLNGQEHADRTMGAAQARIQWPAREPVHQMPDPEQGYFGGAAPVPVEMTPSTVPGKDGSGGAGQPPPPSTQDVLAELPPGSSVLALMRGTVAMRTSIGVVQPDAVAVDASTPLTAGYVSVLAGRAPTAPTEVALTEQAMIRLGAGIGGTVTAVEGDRRFTVVGQVEFPSLLSEAMLFAPVTEADPNWFSVQTRSWLAATPGPVTWADVLRYNTSGMIVSSRDVFEHPPSPDEVADIYGGRSTSDPQELGFGILVAGLALLEIVLLAGPAFAVSARRRQRQLALVAANGGTPAHVRRIVLADGVVLGLIGAGVGIAAGIVAAFAARPFVEELLAHARAGGYRVFPTALLAIAGLAVVTGVLAAVVPAFITARQNIISALAGRRGITRSRKRWLVLGLAMCGLGTLIVIYGTRDVRATVMLGGLIVGELGLVLCTPTLVGLIARAGRILPLGPRIALRDAARNRAAAAPAISAVMAAVAGSVAVGLYFDSSITLQRQEYVPELPAGYVQVFIPPPDAQGAVHTTAAQVESLLRSTLPIGETHLTGAIVCPGTTGTSGYCDMQAQTVPEHTCPYATAMRTAPLSTEEMRAARRDPRCDHPFGANRGTTVDDGTALATLTGAAPDDLARATATLRAGGVVVRDPTLIKDGRVTFAVLDSTKQNLDKSQGDPMLTAPRMDFPGYLLTTGVGRGSTIVSPAALSRAGLASLQNTLVASTTRMPSATEEEKVRGLLQPYQVYPSIEHGAPTQTDPRLWILMAAAAAITLGAAGIGTGLAAADGRQDLSTLAAVGASPRLRRGLSLSQSGVIAGLGSLLGSIAGVGAAIAILVALNQRYVDIWPGPTPMPIVLPWLSLGVALIVVPVIAMLGAGSLTRSRLPIERRL